jgi:hypothetical protein
MPGAAVDVGCVSFLDADTCRLLVMWEAPTNVYRVSDVRMIKHRELRFKPILQSWKSINRTVEIKVGRADSNSG